MTKGVLLLAWGKRGYGFAAHNLAVSIKHHSPNIPITVVGMRDTFRQVADLSMFDNIIWTDEIIQDPGRFKAGLYKFLPYDYTLYLDVDALCLRDINPLFDRLIDSGEYYSTFINEVYDKDSPNVLPQMYWAYKEDVWHYYGFTDEKLPATQSSIQFIHKSTQAEALYDKIEKAFSKPIPLERLRNKWGGTQPDELYLNIALAQTGIAPHIGDDTLWFGNNKNKKPQEVAGEYYFLSFFGSKNNIKIQFWQYYDKMLMQYCKQRGTRHTLKSNFIQADKHASLSRARDANVKYSPIQEWKAPPVQSGITLYTSYFRFGHPLRQKELEESMQRNIACSFIDRIVSLGDLKYDHPKVENVHYTRPTYADFILEARKRNSEYTVIANSDIYFDSTLLKVKDMAVDTAYALSRYDVKKTGETVLFNYEYSQDTWIFKGEIKDLQSINFTLGLPGCDNRFAYEMQRAGYTVVNPATEIRTYHLHNSNKRTYRESNRLKGEYLHVRVQGFEKRLLLIQPGKVGDILICAPIAKHYADQGYNVEWLAPHKYDEVLNRLPYVTRVNEKTGNYDKVIDISFGLDQKSPHHKLWLDRRKQGQSFAALKYELSGVPIGHLRQLTYNRDESKEQTLLDLLHPGEPYKLVHRNSDYGTGIDVHGVCVYFEPVEGYSIFDWRKVIEQASEIHCIDSSLANFVDCLTVEGKLYYYITDKVPMPADRTILTDTWAVVNTLEYAHS